MKVSYRPEIDGLRAIAVFAVIIYHAKITIFGDYFLKGGFLGVDIFFVISGYLITKLILKEIYTKKNFSFTYFYQRRIRRILPVLFLVIICSIPLAYFTLLPINFVDFSKSSISSVFFTSNIFFHVTGQKYEAIDSLLVPLLHIWSLSVEEQFYILFPISLIFFYRFYKKNLTLILLFGIIVSLIFAEITSRSEPSLSFYSLHTRGWELLAGSLLAKLELDNKKKIKLQKTYYKYLPFIGILLILLSFIVFNDQIFHPSIYTLPSVAGVMLIIWYSDKNEIVTRILSTKIFVFFGLISYSLYLWHYPIFAFARNYGFVSGDLTKKIIIGFSVLFLSILSYYLVEKPFRNKAKITFKNVLIFLTFCLIFLVPFNYYIIEKEGLKKRLPATLQEDFRPPKLNEFSKNGKSGRVLLIGDSHSNVLEYHLNEKLKNNNFSLNRFFTALYVKDLQFFNKKTGKIDEQFEKDNKKISKFLDKNKNSIVIVHNKYALRILETDYKGREKLLRIGKANKKNISDKGNREQDLLDVFIQSLKEISKNNKLIIVYPVPGMEYSAPRKILNQTRKGEEIPIISSSYDYFKERNKIFFNSFDQIKNDNVFRVYPHKIFCDKQIKNKCVANNKNELFYMDNNHLSLRGSELVVDEIFKVIKTIN